MAINYNSPGSTDLHVYLLPELSTDNSVPMEGRSSVLRPTERMAAITGGRRESEF